METSLHGGRKGSPLDPFQIVIKRKITVLRGIRKQKTAYEIMPSLVGSEMCIRDRFWVYPQFATITLDLCMHSLHNLTMFYSYACQLLYTMELNM